ncbi:hypothetical protein TWF718_005890 [Orbilia javanica]|uniref:Uncharacterized protein n=1 Tax=Orbilia javanica TaxID=47235 RepID=A0AAN8RP84_9PEZI
MLANMDIPSFQPEPRQYIEPYNTPYQIPSSRERKGKSANRNKIEPATVTFAQTGLRDKVTPRAASKLGGRRGKDIPYLTLETPKFTALNRKGKRTVVIQPTILKEEPLNDGEYSQTIKRSEYNPTRKPASPPIFTKNPEIRQLENTNHDIQIQQQLELRPRSLEDKDVVTSPTANTNDAATTTQLGQIAREDSEGIAQDTMCMNDKAERIQEQDGPLKESTKDGLIKIQQSLQYSPNFPRTTVFGVVVAGFIFNSVILYIFTNLVDTESDNSLVRVSLKFVIASGIGVTMGAIILMQWKLHWLSSFSGC